jgi:hypothetical protein
VDTLAPQVGESGKKNRWRTKAERRAIVEETLLPDASVSRIVPASMNVPELLTLPELMIWPESVIVPLLLILPELRNRLDSPLLIVPLLLTVPEFVKVGGQMGGPQPGNSAAATRSIVPELSMVPEFVNWVPYKLRKVIEPELTRMPALTVEASEKKMVPAFIKLPPESVVRMPPNSPNVMEALEAFTIFPPFISCAPSPSLWINR